VRVEPVSDPSDQQLALLAKSLPGPDGKPLNVFATLAHFPELMKRVNAMGGYFFVAGELPVRDRELVILRVAAHTRSEYELGQHRWIAPRAGLDAAEIDAAVDPSAQQSWSARHTACLAFVDELLAVDTVSDAIWKAAHEHFTVQQLVELLALTGYYRMLAGILNGLQVELDESVMKEIGR